MTLEKRPLLDKLALRELEDLEAKVKRLPDSTHKTLMFYEIASLIVDLRNIEQNDTKK